MNGRGGPTTFEGRSFHGQTGVSTWIGCKWAANATVIIMLSHDLGSDAPVSSLTAAFCTKPGPHGVPCSKLIFVCIFNEKLTPSYILDRDVT